jgi:hypothetical protein
MFNIFNIFKRTKMLPEISISKELAMYLLTFYPSVRVMCKEWSGNGEWSQVLCYDKEDLKDGHYKTFEIWK